MKEFNITLFRFLSNNLPSESFYYPVKGTKFEDKEKEIYGFIHRGLTTDVDDNIVQTGDFVLADYYSGGAIVRAKFKKDIPDALHDLFIAKGKKAIISRIKEIRKTYKANL